MSSGKLGSSLLFGHTNERDSCTFFAHFLKCSSCCSHSLSAWAAFVGAGEISSDASTDAEAD